MITRNAYGRLNHLTHYIMEATIITTEDLRNSEARNYNPSEWDKKINRYLERYSDVVFYQVPKGYGYTYDRHYVEYTLPEGLRLFSEFDYGSSLTNGGFYRVDKFETTADGRTHSDMFDLVNAGLMDEAKALLDEIEASTTYKIKLGKFQDEATGTMVCIGTGKEARAWMAERSKNHGLVFSKGL